MAFGGLGLNRCVSNRKLNNNSTAADNNTPKWLQVRQGQIPLPKGTVTIPLRFNRSSGEALLSPPPAAPAVPAPPKPAPAPAPVPPLLLLPPAPPPSDLWTERFRGKKVADIVGHETVIASLRNWIQKRLNPDLRAETPLVAFLSGPPGTGKTTLSYAVLAEAGLLVEEVNASEERTEAGVWDKLTKITLTKSMVTKGSVALILDEIDGGTEGTLKALEKFIKLYAETNTPVAPIICIANSLANKNLREFARKRKSCLDLRVYALPAKEMAQVSAKVLSLMGKNPKQYPLLNTIIQASNGDVRKLLNLLQQGHTEMRQLNLAVGDPFTNLFKMTQIILSRAAPPRIQYALLEQEPEIATLMLQHNYPHAMVTPKGFSSAQLPEAMASLADMFSAADVLEHAWDAAFWSPEEYSHVMVIEAMHKNPFIQGNNSYMKTEFPVQYFQTRFKRPEESAAADDVFETEMETDKPAGRKTSKSKTKTKPQPTTDAEKAQKILQTYPLVPHPLRYTKMTSILDDATQTLVDFRINY